MLLNEEFVNLYEELSNLNEAETGISYDDKCLYENIRSSAEIQAEIEKLQQELAQAKIAEKKAAYAGNLPKVVYIWDMYMDANEKGTWTSAELKNNTYEGTVFETEKDARDAALNLLSELDDEDELDSDEWNDDYYIDAVEIPLSKVSENTLRFSNLDHLIS